MMTLRVKALIGVVVAGAIASLCLVPRLPPEHWTYFFVYLAAILLSSGMKVALPKRDGTMSANFPFIFLGIVQLSPLQAVLLAASSVIAQCRIRVVKPFTLVQIVFNVANVTTATVLATLVYAESLRPLHHEVAPALALAATGYFLANTVPIALVISWDSETEPFRQWREEYLWYLPFYLVGAMLAAAVNFIGIMFGWLTSLLLIPLVYIVYRAYCAQMAIVRDRERHIVETEALHLRTIEGLAMAIEAKDRNTHRHLMRVRVYVSELGKILGLDPSLMKALLTAAFLHDIGKLAVPEHIINKPGKLTHEEFEKMKIHPVVGADILERVHFPYPVVPIVRSHHEAWDGSGYPDGLRGEEIPIGARILTVVDCFDALASERPYRRALPLDEAMTMVKSKSGIQFDPAIVRLLEARYPELEELARQQIEEVEPLKTDLFIERGAAPGAGFAPEPSAQAAAGVAQHAGSGSIAAAIHREPLSLIAEASQEAKAIFELSQMLGTSLGAREISSMMSMRLQPLIPFDCFAVYLRRETSVAAQYIDGRCARAFSAQPIPMGEGLSGWVAENRRPIVNGNPTVEPNLIAECGLFSAHSSALSVPLFDLGGDTFAVVTLYSCKPAAFTDDHLRTLQAIESRFSLSLQNAMRFEAAETDARVDRLTQLWNTQSFFRHIAAEIERVQVNGGEFGVVVCDLNSFKSVNDRHGHAIGNELLRAIAREFRCCCGPADAVARMGGDEFAFLFSSLSLESADWKLKTLEQGLQRACHGLQIEAGISGSMGVAFCPRDGKSPEELLGIADRGMYLQKRHFYSAHNNREAPPVLAGIAAS